MTTPNSNNDILSSAEYTIQIAKKELGRNLDYSANSLKDLDALIEHVKKRFSRLSQEGKLTDQTVQRASTSIGLYLGEVIRRNYGGAWVSKNSVLRILVISGNEFSPVLYIFERLTKDSKYTLENYWLDLAQKLQPQDSLHNIKSTPKVDEKNTPLVGSKEGNKSLLVVGVIAGIVVLCAFGILATIVYSNIKTANEFKAKLNPFLVEAEKLNVMTEQGVTYQEFRTQLIEVKSTYASIDSWPVSYQDEKRSFDLAIKGWEYTLELWNFQLYALGLSNNIGERPDYEGIEIYLGGNTGTNSDEEIGLLMSQASVYYETGKLGVKESLMQLVSMI